MYTRELIQRTQITRDTLRHYNDIGLLHPKVDPKNNYKIYCENDIELIFFIKKSQKIGFSLSEIKKIAKQIRSATCKHQSLIPHLEEQLAEINERIATLQKIKKQIRSLIVNFEKKNCEIHPTNLEM